MRAGRLGVLAGVLWGATVGAVTAAPAAPPPSANFTLLQQICIDTHANRAAAVAAGQAAGIGLPPANGADLILSSLQIEDPEVHAKLAGAAVTMLIVGHKSTTIAGQPVTMNLCIIATPTPDADADEQLTDWVATAPVSNHNGNPSFFYSGEAGRHLSAGGLSDDQALAEIRKGDMQSTTILHLQNSTALVYAVFSA